MKDILTQQSAYWNRAADSFHAIYTHNKSSFANMMDALFRNDMYERFRFTIEQCEPIVNRTFLDVGCGSGEYMVELTRRGASRVVGLDIAEKMLMLSKQAAEKYGVLERCEFIHSDLLKYEGHDIYDVSYGIGLFDYIRDPLPVLQAMRSRTADKTIVAFPRLWTWRAAIRKARLALRGCDVFFYTKSKVRALMKEAGFDQITIVTLGKLLCVVGGVKRKRR